MIVTIVFTWHTSCAVVKCAKHCSDMIARKSIVTILITMEKSLELLLWSKRCNGKVFRHYHNQQTYCSYGYGFRADSIFAPSQWGTALLCNDVSHWLGASLESDLGFIWRSCYSLRPEIWIPMKYCEILLLFIRWPTTILNVSTCALKGICRISLTMINSTSERINWMNCSILLNQ